MEPSENPPQFPYWSKSRVRLATMRLGNDIAHMRKDALTFHDQFENRAASIIASTTPWLHDYAYQKLHGLVVRYRIGLRSAQA